MKSILIEQDVRVMPFVDIHDQIIDASDEDPVLILDLYIPNEYKRVAFRVYTETDTTK